MIGRNSVLRGNIQTHVVAVIAQNAARPMASAISTGSWFRQNLRCHPFCKNRPFHPSPPKPRTAHSKPATSTTTSA